MVSPEDSLVAPAKVSPLKPILIAAAAISLGVGGWWTLGRGKGQPEDPARVLIIGPTPELAGYLERKGFDVDYLSFGAAVGEGQAFDSSLADLAAVIEYADQSGFGFVALDMSHGQQYALAEVEYAAAEPPPGTTFVVISIGDLGKHVSYGGVPLGVTHEHPLDEQIGLLLALFGQPEISKARTREADNDLMIRFGSAGTVEDVVEIEKAHENMRRQVAAWEALAEKEKAATKPIELARPYEQLHGWPLANGAILLGSLHGTWRSEDGLETSWDAADATVDFSVIHPSKPGERGPCSALPDTLHIDEFAVAADGDALLLPSSDQVADLWVLSGEGCEFERRSEIRRLGGGAFGQPRASGRTVDSQSGRLSWADAKMRAYRNVRFAGVELRPEAVRWISDDVVVVPASLAFVEAADDRRRRANAALVDAGLPAPELEPVDPATVPADRDAIVFIRLPAHEDEGEVELAVIPVDALVAGDPSAVNVRAVFPVAGEAPTAVVYLDAADGLQLVRASLPATGPAWQNGLAPTYELSEAVAAARSEVAATPLARELPQTAQDLVVSPTADRAAWASPVGEAQHDAGDGNFEIFALALATDGAKPVRLTDNNRSDLDVMFVRDSTMLLFYSAYSAAEKLPTVYTLRALAQ